MQFLKILLWVLVAFGAALFTVNNAISVPINLWGGLVAEINLPFLLLLTFLVGMVPTWAYYRTIRWRLSQRLAASERVIADLKPVPVPMGATPLPAQTISPAPEPSADDAAPAQPVTAPAAPPPSPPSPPSPPTEPFSLTP